MEFIKNININDVVYNIKASYADIANSVENKPTYTAEEIETTNNSNILTELDNIHTNINLIENLVNDFSSIKDIIDDATIPFYNIEEYVDLGLPSGTLWAKCNLGAVTPEDGGLLYLWGRIDGYPINDENHNFLSKENYISASGKEYNENENLIPLDDAAYIISKGIAHIPTKELFEELMANTTLTIILDENYVKNGSLLITGNNGNTIYLPNYYYYYWDEGFVVNFNYLCSTCKDSNHNYVYEKTSPLSYWEKIRAFPIRPVIDAETIRKREKLQASKIEYNNTNVASALNSLESAIDSILELTIDMIDEMLGNDIV